MSAATETLRSVGAAAFDVAADARDLARVFGRTVRFAARGRRAKGAVVRQMFEVGWRSLFFLTVVMGFLGMILVFQAALQARRIVPDLTLLGATFLELLVRDLAPSIGALMIATRVGAGIAAEIGSMVVTEQVDALRMCAADPIDYLVVPRFIAGIVMGVALTIWSTAVAEGVGLLTGWMVFGILPTTFWNLTLVDAGDLTVGLTKAVAYGAAVPIVSSWCGLGAYGGAEGVGSATTRAVVGSSLAVIVLNFLISGLGYFVFP
jgi:phospholipid/cholesterol/gamma-HCH transport system permease protein